MSWNSVHYRIYLLVKCQCSPWSSQWEADLSVAPTLRFFLHLDNWELGTSIESHKEGTLSNNSVEFKLAPLGKTFEAKWLFVLSLQPYKYHLLGNWSKTNALVILLSKRVVFAPLFSSMFLSSCATKWKVTALPTPYLKVNSANQPSDFPNFTHSPYCHLTLDDQVKVPYRSMFFLTSTVNCVFKAGFWKLVLSPDSCFTLYLLAVWSSFTENWAQAQYIWVVWRGHCASYREDSRCVCCYPFWLLEAIRMTRSWQCSLWSFRDSFSFRCGVQTPKPRERRAGGTPSQVHGGATFRPQYRHHRLHHFCHARALPDIRWAISRTLLPVFFLINVILKISIGISTTSAINTCRIHSPPHPEEELTLRTRLNYLQAQRNTYCNSSKTLCKSKAAIAHLQLDMCTDNGSLEKLRCFFIDY